MLQCRKAENIRTCLSVPVYEYNRPVFSKLERVPDNVYDNNAIAVYVMTDDNYDKVGYIASELT